MKKITILLLFLNSAILFSQENTYTILVSFDGFRWDYLNRGITPNLNKIAESGVKAISMEPCFPSKTFPNHLSIITGMYPENHGIISNYFENSATGEIYKLG
ncbi:MAG: alkaline phosphatase family protein, partial [Melioribacteraceae bacterium]|nr:alkaline phosphatase family protein [Melioribacteraceae bacterium]